LLALAVEDIEPDAVAEVLVVASIRCEGYDLRERGVGVCMSRTALDGAMTNTSDDSKRLSDSEGADDGSAARGRVG